MSTIHTYWLKPALLSTTLAFAMSGCEAKSDSPATIKAATQVGAQPSAPAASTAGSASAVVFAGSYLFDARDTQSDFGKAHSQDVKRYSAAFNALLADQVKHERKFIQRITSGPSTQGEVFDIDGQSSVVHVTCQAHRCDLERMGVFYTPQSNRMSAILWSHCEEAVLGSPTAMALSSLRQIAKMPPPTAQDVARCKNESAAYE